MVSPRKRLCGVQPHLLDYITVNEANMAEPELEGTLNDFFVTETVFNSGIQLATVETFLRERKTTGKIMTEFNMSQGGNQTVKVIERTKLTNAQAEQIREILGFF